MANSVFEEDLTVEGNITSKEGSVEVKGSVVGDLTAQSVVVQVGGSVDGALAARSVAIEGKHNGKLQCDDLKLASTSRVTAEVSAKSMSTESGAKIEGSVKVSGAT